LGGGVEITEIQWADADALPSPLCISARTDADHNEKDISKIAVARGNIVLADHGQTIPRFKPRFSASEITHASSLAEKLATSHDGLWAYIRSRMPGATRESLVKSQPPASLPPQLLREIVDALNAIVSGGPIWDKQLFAQVTLRPEVHDLVESKPKDGQLM